MRYSKISLPDHAIRYLVAMLRAVLELLHGSPPPFELADQRGRYDDGNRLLDAVQDYLDGWQE